MHPMEPTIHGVASAVRRLSRNTCGSPAAVLRSEIRKASAPPYRFSLRAILFYLCLNILKHCAVRPCSPCHSTGPLPIRLLRPSSLLQTFTCHSGHFGKRKTVSDLYVYLSGSSRECKESPSTRPKRSFGKERIMALVKSSLCRRRGKAFG